MKRIIVSIFSAMLALIMLVTTTGIAIHVHRCMHSHNEIVSLVVEHSCCGDSCSACSGCSDTTTYLKLATDSTQAVSTPFDFKPLSLSVFVIPFSILEQQVQISTVQIIDFSKPPSSVGQMLSELSQLRI